MPNTSMTMGVSRKVAMKTAGFKPASLFRALKHANFRLFFIGQSISLIGTWLQITAMSWLVYRLTGSALLLGVVGFTSQLPSIFISPFAGVLSDRWNKRSMLMVTQSMALVQALILAVLVLTGVVATWHIIVLSLFMGIINSFDMPIRQSFMMEIVDDRNDIGNALALNSANFNSARLIGPTVAGLVISLVGEGVCFMLNSLSYVAVLIALSLMKVESRPVSQKSEPVLGGLKAGFRYVFGFSPIRYILLYLSLVSLVALPYTTLMPVFARDTFKGGAHTMGFLMSSTGAGALLGAIYLASRRTILGLGRHMYVAGAVFGVSLIAFAVSSSLPLSMVMLFLAGFGMIVLTAAANTILQTVSDEDKRGRVMSFYALSFMGVSTFGNLMYGALAGLIGARWTVVAGGTAVVISAGVFARQLPEIRKLVRPIYIRDGIISEIGTGLHSATRPMETLD